MTDRVNDTNSAATVADDPIVAAVRADRVAHAAAHGGDLRRIVEAYREIEARERKRGRKMITPRAVPGAVA
jgi:hypothetical protein